MIALTKIRQMNHLMVNDQRHCNDENFLFARLPSSRMYVDDQSEIGGSGILNEEPRTHCMQLQKYDCIALR